jgi:hypothetical protein
MLARDQFLDRVGAAGVSNSSLILKAPHRPQPVTYQGPRTCRYKKTAGSYARSTFLEARSLVLRYRIDGGEIDHGI